MLVGDAEVTLEASVCQADGVVTMERPESLQRTRQLDILCLARVAIRAICGANGTTFLEHCSRAGSTQGAVYQVIEVCAREPQLPCHLP